MITAGNKCLSIVSVKISGNGFIDGDELETFLGRLVDCILTDEAKRVRNAGLVYGHSLNDLKTVPEVRICVSFCDFSRRMTVPQVFKFWPVTSFVSSLSILISPVKPKRYFYLESKSRLCIWADKTGPFGVGFTWNPLRGGLQTR